MNITVLADASFCPETNVAGYGYWIASARGKMGGGGAMRFRVPSSTVAEMQAVANALHIGVKSGLIQKGDFVLIQTDCIAAISAFEHMRRCDRSETEVVKVVDNIAITQSLALDYRHVKGHSKEYGARFISNNMCDRRAKAAMRQLRDSILSQRNNNEYFKQESS